MTVTDTLPPTCDVRISPRGGLDILSRAEVARLQTASTGGLRHLLRRCALAVLTTDSDSDDPRAAALRYPDFDIEVQQQDRGIKIELKGAPATAFVDGEIIRGIAENLFAVVREDGAGRLRIRFSVDGQELMADDPFDHADTVVLVRARDGSP